MKKAGTVIIAVIISSIIVIGSTFAPTRVEVLDARVEKVSSAMEDDYRIVIIEGCEYIVYSAEIHHRGHGFMAHKGNCKNH